jgi:molybdopterin synthase catalytic subunit
LKTQAPFWKKELTAGGERWLDDKDSDHDAQKRW